MIRRLFAVRGSRQRGIDAIIRQVAEMSVEPVCQLAAARVSAMGPCEARGYIRARAGREVRRQTRLAVAKHRDAETSWESAIAARAADRVVPLALRHMASSIQLRGAKAIPCAAAAARRAA